VKTTQQTLQEIEMANVEIIKFGHFYNEGARGNAGGAASNDKIWGIAKIDGKLVNFWGRRNGKLKFKTRYLSEMGKVMEKWAEKIGGRTDGGDVYTPILSATMQMTLCPRLVQDVTKHFYSDLAKGKVNTNH
jgi:hypothetical protein